MHPPSPALSVGRLRRIQTGARAVLTLGIGASLAANVMAADPSLAGRVIAAWSPLALLLTIELLSRVPVSAARLSRLRVVAASTIAGIAAWVSYWHMVEVAETFGEAAVAAHLLPFSVDGLVIVASVCLVEISDRLTHETAASDRSEVVEPRQTELPLVRSEPVSTSTSAPAVDSKPATAKSSANRSGVGDEVRRLAAEYPEWTQAELADAAACSVRTVRRHLTDSPTAAAADLESRPVELGRQSGEEVAA